MHSPPESPPIADYSNCNNQNVRPVPGQILLYVSPSGKGHLALAVLGDPGISQDILVCPRIS